MATRREPNERLRAAIAESGCTYDAIARDVRTVGLENGERLQTNKSAVAHWINGATPSRRTGRYLAEALTRRLSRSVTMVEIGLKDAEGGLPFSEDPVTAVTDLGRADLERRRFLTTAAFTAAGVAMPLTYDQEAVARSMRAAKPGAAVGAKEIEVVRRVTLAFRAADEQLGGGHGLTTVTAYLADTAGPMLRGRFPSDEVRRDAFGAVSELVYLAGWKHHDLGHEGAAQHYYLTGYQLALEADPHGHAAWMMRALAHQALTLKQPRHCVALSDASLSRGVGHVDGRTEALLHITHARAYAAVGEGGPAARSLRRAEDALHRGDEPQPTYSTACGPAAGTVASHTAKTLTGLRDYAGTEHHFRAALNRWNPDEYKRVQQLTYANLGGSLAAQARADEAVAAWGRALTLLGGMASDRSRKAIAAARPTLAVYQRRGVPGAADLDARVREALRPAAR